MDFISPFLISFTLIFLSELGDKTQLLILSFSAKIKTIIIIIGIALGSLFSHGIAIMFGSLLGMIENPTLQATLQIITYFSFLLIGIITLFQKEKEDNNKKSIIQKITNISFNYVLMIAFLIIVGEIGDKTFLASMALGIQYPVHKIPIICGAVLGMILSNCIAIFLGKFLKKFLPEGLLKKLCGVLFILFGVFGLFFL